MTSDAVTQQPNPMPARQDRPSAHRQVIQALLDREELGLDRYGTRLLPDNGRSNPVDAFQEVLDLAVYWQNWLAELAAYDGVDHRAVVLPSGRIAVRLDDGSTYPWIAVEPAGLELRFFGDDELPPGSTPLVREVVDRAGVARGLDLNELYEKLAEIEHVRWSEWQRHVFSLCDERPDGSYVIPARRARVWKRMLSTDYADLTEEEKDGDRNQVDRYWELITGERPGEGRR